jgi:large subunit ribosomal protein L15e
MGMYQAIREMWKDPRLDELYKQRLIQWRKEDVITSVERPTRLDRARSLGYKAKKGISIIRVRVARGGRKREWRKHGRRSRTMRRKKIVGMSYQWIAEQKAQRTHKNLEVLNSYFVGKDGIYSWYEVIMLDPFAPEIKSDKNLNWICYRKQTYRVLRGKTSAARKSRGLLKKGKGAEKLRPSRRAHNRLAK